MKLFHTLRHCKHVSVLIIPDGRTRTFEYRLNTLFCKFLSYAVLFCLVGVIILGATYWHVARVARHAERLERENDFLWRENAKVLQLQQTLLEMKQIDYRLKKLAGVKIGTDLSTTAEEPVGEARDLFSSDQQVSAMSQVGVDAVREKNGGTVNLARWSGASFRTRPTLWPVQGWVTAEFSAGAGSFGKKHTGIDIAAPADSPVLSSADGVVTFAGWTQDLGNMVILEHDDTFSSRYGHNSKVLVEQGERVRQGQTIAFVGSSGRSSAPHLHFEVWKDGRPVNPRDYIIR